jgi:hypothetical protein
MQGWLKTDGTPVLHYEMVNKILGIMTADEMKENESYWLRDKANGTAPAGGGGGGGESGGGGGGESGGGGGGESGGGGGTEEFNFGGEGGKNPEAAPEGGEPTTEETPPEANGGEKTTEFEF